MSEEGCPNCYRGVAGVPFCELMMVFRPTQTVMDACARRKAGESPMTWKDLKAKLYPKKASAQEQDKEALNNKGIDKYSDKH